MNDLKKTRRTKGTTFNKASHLTTCHRSHTHWTNSTLHLSGEGLLKGLMSPSSEIRQKVEAKLTLHVDWQENSEMFSVKITEGREGKKQNSQPVNSHGPALTRNCPHSFHWWNFRLISRWLFPQIIPARHQRTLIPASCLHVGFPNCWQQPTHRRGPFFLWTLRLSKSWPFLTAHTFLTPSHYLTCKRYLQTLETRDPLSFLARWWFRLRAPRPVFFFG